MDGSAGAGSGPAKGMVTLPTPLASEVALASPDEGCGIGIPAACGRFEPVDEVVGTRRGLSGESAADEDALDRLGHVQPGAAQGRIQRHDSVCDQPEDQARRLVASEVVQHQQHLQRWQVFRQGEPDGESCLPALPGRAALGFGLARWRRQSRQDRRHFRLQPGVQDRVGCARHARGADLTRGRVEQGEQFGGALAEVLMGKAGRTGRRLPVGPRLRNRLIRPRLILGPDRQRRLGIGLFDQPLFAVASGS